MLFGKRRQVARPRIMPTIVKKRSIFETGQRTGIRGPDGTEYAGDVGASLPGWLASLQPADQSIRQSLDSLRRASRVEAARAGHLRAAILTLRRDVVGNGLMLHSLHPDRDVRMAVESAWKQWCMDCDVTGRRSWRQFCHAALASLIVDGEALVKIHEGGSHTHGVGIELIDAVRLQVEANTPNAKARGSNLVMGVEMDNLGKPIAYWISDRLLGTATGGGSYANAIYPTYRTPAEMILHVYDDAEFPGMVRGIPMVYSALKRLSDIRDYDDSERAAARKGSELYATYTPPDGVGGEYAHGKDDDPKAIELVSNDVVEIEAGASMAYHDPSHPNTQYEAFVFAQLRSVAASLGISYASLTADLSQSNFTGSRVGRLAEWGTVMMLRHLLVERMAMPLYQKWVMRAYTSRELLPNVPLDALMNVEFVGPVMQHVQPAEKAKAEIMQIEAGLKSKAEVIREDGRRPEDVMREVAEERAGEANGEALPEPDGDDDSSRSNNVRQIGVRQ